MDKKKTIYLCGPISGHDYKDIVEYYKTTTTKLEDIGYNTLCPLAAKSYLRNEIRLKAHGYDNHPASTNHAIKTRDRWMIGNSDIILANLSQSGDRVSIGSVMEIGWADELRKFIVAIIPKHNIHNHAFILEACSVIFYTIEEAYKFLEDMNASIYEL